MSRVLPQPKIAVIGAGIIGLTCVAELLDAGFHNMTVFAEQVSPHTTSDVAAALWTPYKAYPEHLVNQWCSASLATLKALLKNNEAGVSWITYKEIYKSATPAPVWMNLVEQVDPSHQELPPGYASGYTVKVPLINSALHLSYLMQLLKNNKIAIKQEKISAITDLTKPFDIVINCTGLGAKELVGDMGLYPIRGQVVIFTKPQHLNYAIVDLDEKPTYIIPRLDDCIVGGTAEKNNWDLTPDPETTRLIINRAYAVCPELKEANMLGVKVGLRPGRDTIRLDTETVNGRLVIHNYGHGGAGYTLAWGCAAEVKKLVNDYSRI